MFTSVLLIFGAGWVGKLSYTLTLCLVWLLSILLTACNWWHYQYFRSYFNYQLLNLGTEAPDSLRAISSFEYWPQALILGLATGAVVLVGIRFYQRQHFRSRTSAGAMAVCLVGALGGGVLVNNSVANYRALNMLHLSPAYFSPVHAFFVSMETGSAVKADEVASETLFVEMNNGARQEDGLEGEQSYNVIVIMLESVRASALGFYNGQPGMTPHLDQFASEFWVATNFYANTNFTVKGETATWCGVMDYNVQAPYSTHKNLKDMTCLPRLLKDEGYSTRFYHGYSSHFYSRDVFLPKVGFSHSYFHANTASNEASQLGWGISDEALYNLMLQDLEALSEPFFAHVTTLSSHYPFNWDWPEIIKDGPEGENKLYRNYRRAVSYEDYAFGQFWQQFRDSDLASNTIVVVTADHGVWTFSDSEDKDNAVVLDEKFFRMPLLIYHPDRPQHGEVSQVSSQLDIAPTILAMLGMDHSQFIGKNIFQEVERPWALMMKSGQVAVRVEDTICRIADRSCSGLHQECVARQFGELFTKRFTDMQVCYELEGDLLEGGSYEKVNEPEPWLEHGFNLINLHNKEVFGASRVTN